MAIWGSMVCHEGKGTCQVIMPKFSAMGWNSQILVKEISSERMIGTSNHAYSRELDGKVGEQDHFRAFPLFLGSRNLIRLKFPLAEIWNSIDDNPRDGTSEVHKLERASRSVESTEEK